MQLDVSKMELRKRTLELEIRKIKKEAAELASRRRRRRLHSTSILHGTSIVFVNIKSILSLTIVRSSSRVV